MTTNTYWQLEKEYYTIATDHDLVIRIVEHQIIARTEGDGEAAHAVTEDVPSKVHEYKVKRETMTNSSAYFAKMLAESNFKESQQDTIDLHENNATAMTVWLKIVHDAVDDSTYQVTIEDMWYILTAAEKYDFNSKSEKAKSWFEKWYTTQIQHRNFDYKEHQSMLLPCYTFDYAPGFRTATKYLVYRATGHITERRPLNFEHESVKLDQAILQQLNAAKARLKTILHRNLHNPIDDLLKRARCRCKAEVLYAYERTLVATGAWPLESTFLNNSVEYTLRKLESVPAQTFQPQSCGARWCTFDFRYVVGSARMEVKRYFDGLCLDCMADSESVAGGAAEEAFWSKSKVGVHWDKGCRVRHQQPTWYFSFQGKRAKMAEWVESKRNHGNGNGNGNHRQNHVSGAAHTAVSVPASAAEGN